MFEKKRGCFSFVEISFRNKIQKSVHVLFKVFSKDPNYNTS